MGWFDTMNWQEDSDPEQAKCISCQKVLIRGKEHTFCKKCDSIPDYAQQEPTWEDSEFGEGASHGAGQGGADSYQEDDSVVEEEWR
tara:strand:- start:76 stop:333 length:258 start_codon:yes stop_codon:yes gene_type:complete